MFLIEAYPTLCFGYHPPEPHMVRFLLQKFAVHAKKLSTLKWQLILKQADQYLWRHHRHWGSRWWMHAVSAGICTVAFRHGRRKDSVKIRARTKRGIVGDWNSRCSQISRSKPSLWKAVQVGTRNSMSRTRQRVLQKVRIKPHRLGARFFSPSLWTQNYVLLLRPEIQFVCVDFHK